jgi:hypothetical protein
MASKGGEEYHEVEEICGVDHKADGTYHIKWSGGDSSDTEWLHESDVNCDDLIQDFLLQNLGKNVDWN